MAGCKRFWAGIIYAFRVSEVAAQTTTLPDWFNGYYIHLVGTTTETSSASCQKIMSSASSGEYANCCKTTDLKVRCPMPTTCVNSTVMFDNGSSYTSKPNESCATMTVYQTSPFGLPSSKQAFCWENWEAFTVYRELTTPTASTSGSDTALTAMEGSTVEAPTASNTSGRSLADSVGADQSASKGWIAGVVVGPVIGVALGVCGVLFGYRKMRQARQLQERAAVPVPLHVYQQPCMELDSAGIYRKP